MGALLATAGVGMGAFFYVPQPGQVMAMGEITNISVTTEKIKPTSVLPDATGMSQRYSATHNGLDLTGPKGSSIYPIANGQVEAVESLTVGYGRHVIIKHSNGTTSLYAHMGKITVDEGQVVTRETKIGEIGMTGHTTGPHLHLEIRKNEVNVNPIPYLK